MAASAQQLNGHPTVPRGELEGRSGRTLSTSSSEGSFDMAAKVEDGWSGEPRRKVWGWRQRGGEPGIRRARPSMMIVICAGAVSSIFVLLASGTTTTRPSQSARTGHLMRGGSTIEDLLAEKRSFYLMPASTFYAWPLRRFLDAPHTFASDRTAKLLRRQAEDRRRRRDPAVALAQPPLSPRQASRLDMTQLECEAEFPLFENIIEENLRWWSARDTSGRGKGGVRKEDIDAAEKDSRYHWGWARVLIDSGRLYIRLLKYSKLPGITGSERITGVLYLLHQAVAAAPASDPPLPPVDLVFSMADGEKTNEDEHMGENAGWVLDRRVGNQTGMWLMPDYGFVGWPSAGIPSLSEVWQEMDQVERSTPWDRKADKAFWRGLPNGYPVRVDLLDRVSTPSAATWSDVKSVEINNIPAAFEPPAGWTLPSSIPSHCAHKLLLSPEGNAYSGRLKYLLSCGGELDGEGVGAVTITHPLQWEQHFHVALNSDPVPVSIPSVIRTSSGPPTAVGLGWSSLFDDYEMTTTQNIVTLPGPLFDGLKETVRELRRDDAKARTIARNAARTMRHRYLTPAATVCYTRWALRAYGIAMAEGGYTPPGYASMTSEREGHRGNGQFVVRPGGGVRRPPGDETTEGDVEYGSWIVLGMPERPSTR